MSGRHYYKLDNELARANELATIGQLDNALDHLLKVITTIGYHSNMSGFDALFERFLELAVHLRRGKAAKDGLFAYRNLYQNQNVLLVEAVLLTFLDLLDAEMNKVLREVPELPATSLNDDLDTADYSPEALLAQAYGISLFSDADEHDRKYRECVLPVLRFAWEGYRSVLDCARNNNRLEGVYEKAGHRSILFCTKHRRPAEFRRLCELFRYHLHVAIKYPGQSSSISLEIPESQQRQVNLRFACLEAASDFGLWQEAFRVIEDIHSVFSASRRRPSSMPISYYQRLAQIFAASRRGNNPLFLAATWHRIFHSARANKEDQSLPALMTILSTLAIPALPQPDNSLTPEERHSKLVRLSSFIGSHRPPQRLNLLHDLRERNIFGQADKSLRELYDLYQAGPRNADLETIATWTAKIQPLIDDLEAKYHEQIKSLVQDIRSNVIVRALQCIGAHYDSISFDQLSKSLRTPIRSIEALLLHGCHTGAFMAKINQEEGMVRFDRTRYLLNGAETAAMDAQASVRGPLRLDGWTYLVSQITELVERLDLIKAPSNVQNVKSLLMKDFTNRLRREHAQSLADIEFVNQQRAQAEASEQARLQEEAKARAIHQQVEQAALQQRIAEDNARRERERLEKEREEIRREEARKGEEERTRMQAITSAKASHEKLTAAVRRADYLERATREEERPLLEQDAKRQQIVEREAYETKVRQLRDIAMARHQADMEIKAKLPALQADRDLFLKTVQARRLDAFNAAKLAMEDKLAAAKEAHRLEIKAKKAEETERALREEESVRQAKREAERQKSTATYKPPHISDNPPKPIAATTAQGEGGKGDEAPKPYRPPIPSSSPLQSTSTPRTAGQPTKDDVFKAFGTTKSKQQASSSPSQPGRTPSTADSSSTAPWRK